MITRVFILWLVCVTTLLFHESGHALCYLWKGHSTIIHLSPPLFLWAETTGRITRYAPRLALDLTSEPSKTDAVDIYQYGRIYSTIFCLSGPMCGEIWLRVLQRLYGKNIYIMMARIGNLLNLLPVHPKADGSSLLYLHADQKNVIYLLLCLAFYATLFH